MTDRLESAGAAGPSEPDRLPAIAAGLRLAASRFGTPVFVTDVGALDAAAAALREAFPDPWLRQYSVKANDVTAIVRLVAERGFGANVVSRGEWAIARRAGVPNEQITLEGIGKTDADLRAATRAAAAGEPLRWLAIESPDELAALRRLVSAAPPRAPLDLLYRLNPDVVPETARGLAVGAGGTKFGMTETELTAAVEATVAARGALRARGVHVHVGSQLGAVDAWRDGVRRGLAMLALVRGSLSDFDTIDVGGGFPVGAVGAAVPSPARFARELPALLDGIPESRRPARLALEPGRYVVARAGWLVARVLHVRDRVPRGVVLDAGMTELLRPALYGARHEIVALTTRGRPFDDSGAGRHRPLERATVEGPICESTDALGDHDLPRLRRGDLVAIRDVGAYGASQGSAYNGRPRPPQVLLGADGSLTVARRRGSLASLG